MAGLSSINNWFNNMTGANQNFGAQIPEVNPEIGNEAQNELDYASQYQNQLPSEEGQAGAILQNQALNKISSQNAMQTAVANKSGTLYGGTNQNTMAGNAAGTLGQLSAARENLNNQMQQQSNQMMNQAINAKLGYTQAENQRSEAAYNANMQGYGMQFNTMKGLLGGLGSLGGLIGGSQKSPQNNPDDSDGD